MEVISREYVEKELARYRTPGMGVGVIKDGEVLFAGGFGYKDLETKEPIDADTMWGIASCSKSFTATLVGMLVDDGVLDFDRPVKDYLPDFKMYDAFATAECTLRDMFCHRTGLAGYDAVWSDVTITDREELWKRLQYLRPNLPFRYKAQYNNYMVDIAAHVAEKVTGRSWDDMVEERIFKPLGMTRSSTLVKYLDESENVASSYWPGPDGPFKVPHWNSDVSAPAGGINSTINDMLKYLDFHLKRGVLPDGTRLMSEETMRDLHMQNVRYTLWPWRFKEVSPIGGYAMGWYNDNYRGEPMYWHLGEIEGFGTLQCCLPNSQMGIILYNNLQCPDILIQCSVLYTIIDKVLGFEPVDWSERMWSVKDIKGNMHGDWKLDLLGDEFVAGTTPSHDLADYVGTYAEPGHGQLEIDLAGDKLLMTWRGVTQEILHHHYDVFHIPEVKMDTLLVNAPIYFHTDVKGDICGFGFKLYDEVGPIEFVRI
ncbi:MAG: serine hydrolase [Firmicutes bacterium]|nr:serine hydrolase [Bacillota bacterium]